MVHDHAEKKVRRLAVCVASGVRKPKIFIGTFCEAFLKRFWVGPKPIIHSP